MAGCAKQRMIRFTVCASTRTCKKLIAPWYLQCVNTQTFQLWYPFEGTPWLFVWSSDQDCEFGQRVPQPKIQCSDIWWTWPNFFWKSDGPNSCIKTLFIIIYIRDSLCAQVSLIDDIFSTLSEIWHMMIVYPTFVYNFSLKEQVAQQDTMILGLWEDCAASFSDSGLSVLTMVSDFTIAIALGVQMDL